MSLPVLVNFALTEILRFSYSLNLNNKTFFNGTINRRSNMKRFLVVLLALGLIVAFSAPAAAADVKFSGSYYVAGWLQSNQSLQEDAGASNAFYSQRLRVQTVFQVAEGLKLTTRFDAMEKVWGMANADTDDNISWERAYVTFALPIGTLDVGYMSGGTAGTIFADAVASGVPRIKYTYANGPLKVLALIEKGGEEDIGTTAADKDYDKYAVLPIYKFAGGETGILIEYFNDARDSDIADGDYKSRWWLIDPYFKVTAGPVYVEGELLYKMGTKNEYETAGSSDVDFDGWSAYLMAKVDLAAFYVGGQVAWVQGDDPTTTDDEAGFTGQDYNPCLILFQEDALNKFAGNVGTYATTNDTISNAMLYQAFAGFKPIPKLNVKASLTYAQADEKPTGYVDDEYGTEFDITATYKIYDNLSYMVGFGYLFAGDYYKGTSASNKIDDNSLIMNKLTLKF
jgi:hypothetical protein